MSKVKGIVSGTGKGKYSFFIRLDGDPVYYNTKFEPKCSEGDTVGIEFISKGETRANIKKVVVLEKGSGGSSFSSGSSTKFSGGGNNDRQDSIVAQHSQEMAVRYLSVIVEQGGIKLSGNPDAKRTQLDEVLGELTVKFFNEALDFRNSAAFKTDAELREDMGESESEAEDSDGDDWEDNWED